MTSIAKLKDKARKHEQKEDWKAAIQVYQKVLQQQESQNDLDLDLGLFNRIGDLNLRIGRTDEAVSYYEMAADKYAGMGFFNNAIALCNKALRHRPDRSSVYLKLSRLYNEQGFQTDARRWILKYAERELAAGQVEEALLGLEEFANLSDDPEVRELLADQLAAHDHPDQAIDQLRSAYTLRARAGDMDRANAIAKRARSIRPGVDLAAEVRASGVLDRAPEPKKKKHEELARLEPLAEPEETEAPGEGEEDDAATERVSGLEPSFSEQSARARPEDAAPEKVGGLQSFSSGSEGRVEGSGATAAEEESHEDEEPEPLPLLDSAYEDEEADEEEVEREEPTAGTAAPEAAEDADVLVVEYEEEGLDEAAAAPDEATAQARAEPSRPTGGAVDLDLSEAEREEIEPPGAVASEELEPLDLSFEGGLAGEIDVADSGEGTLDLDLSSLGDISGADHSGGLSAEDLDVEAILNRSKELVSRGLMSEALRELRLLSESDAEAAVFRDALAVVKEILRHDPQDVTALQRRVEYAARAGDRELQVDAYLDLGETLLRLGATAKAVVMFRRVLKLEPGNPTAREALGMPAEEEEEEDAAGAGNVAEAAGAGAGARAGAGAGDAAAEREAERVDDLDALLEELHPMDEASGSPESADPEVAAMLDQFRAKVVNGEEPENAGDHYDLGLAFKEMGLVDEAIVEFRIALAGEDRLKVYEELGQCFVLKGEYEVALKVLDRALRTPAAEEAEFLGVYYQMGQCHEALGRTDQARAAYRKVLAIDETFADVPDRMARL